LKVRPLSAVLTLSKAFGVPLLQGAEVFIDFDAFVEIILELFALGNFIGASDSVVIKALGKCSFVWEAGQFIVGLFRMNFTRY
jgi:hypothetical protein